MHTLIFQRRPQVLPDSLRERRILAHNDRLDFLFQDGLQRPRSPADSAERTRSPPRNPGIGEQADRNRAPRAVKLVNGIVRHAA
jgi:hypothetical protein